jgi:hypothetical protein
MTVPPFCALSRDPSFPARARVGIQALHDNGVGILGPRDKAGSPRSRQ